MKEKELERKEVLLDREISLLAERTEKMEKEIFRRLCDLETKMKALELYVTAVLPNNSGTSHSIESQIFDAKQRLS